MAVVADSVGAVRELRKLKPEPKYLMVDLGGSPDDKHKVEVRPKRNRWQSIEGILKTLKWVAITAHDGRGTLVGAVELESEQLEDLETAPTPGTTEHWLQIMLKAQETVLRFNGQHQERLLKAAVDMVAAATERSTALEQSVMRLTKQQERMQQQLLRAAEEHGDEEVAAMAKFVLGHALQNPGGNPQ